MGRKIWDTIDLWFESKGGFAHVVAGLFVTSIAAYAAVPAFKALVDGVYAQLPAWSHQAILAVLGLYAWYKRTSSPLGAREYVRDDARNGR